MDMPPPREGIVSFESRILPEKEGDQFGFKGSKDAFDKIHRKKPWKETSEDGFQ
jgi:hypothetical protein